MATNSGKEEEQSPGLNEARELLRAGWRQGTVIRPCEAIPLPKGHDADCYLVVCTPSCSVVNPNFSADAVVEFAVAKPVPEHKRRSQEATGKNMRKFSLRAAGEGFEALLVDINHRFFVDRTRLISLKPNGPAVTAADARKLAGWLGRFYSRAALPNALVERLRGTVFDRLKEALSAQGVAGPLHESVATIYISWDPESEVKDRGTPYRISIAIICRSPPEAETLERVVLEIIPPDTQHEGLVCEIEALSATETFLSDVDGRVRLTEWDYLSDLGDLADQI